MKCERAKELFSEYLEGSIDYALTATVRAHIDQCDGCRGDLKSFGRAWDVIGTLPEVEPPSSFRHDVVMRAARLQHEEKKAVKQGFLGVTWDYVFGRLLPARALAVACAGAILAMVLLNVPQGLFKQFGGQETGTTVSGVGVRSADELSAAPASDSKEDWQSRTRLGNALWVSVTSTEFCAGSSYYELILTINNKALARDVTNRIPAQVYVLPVGTYALDPAGDRKPMWSGNVLGDSPVQLTVPGISNSKGEPVPITLLVTYQFRKTPFSKLVFIPNKDARPISSDALGVTSGSSMRGGNGTLYGILQMISQDYGKTIIANGSLSKKPAVVEVGSEDVNSTLWKVLKPIDLDWAFIDKAVYVDRPFKN